MSKKPQRSVKTDPATRETTTRESRPGRQVVPPQPNLVLPNRPLLGLSVIGLAIAGYLTYTGLTGVNAAYCEEGGGCDIVQASEWATFMGMPTAFWGFLTYAALAFIALRVKRPLVHWKRAWTIGLLGLAVSVYLTAISVFKIGATCPYCLVSLGVFAAIVGVLVWQRPAAIPGSRGRGGCCRLARSRSSPLPRSIFSPRATRRQGTRTLTSGAWR